MGKLNNIQTSMNLDNYKKINKASYISGLDEITIINLNKWIALRQLVCRELVFRSSGPVWEEPEKITFTFKIKLKHYLNYEKRLKIN